MPSKLASSTPLEERQAAIDDTPTPRDRRQKRDHKVRLSRGVKIRGQSFNEGEVVERLTIGEAIMLCTSLTGCGRDRRPCAQLLEGVQRGGPLTAKPTK